MKQTREPEQEILRREIEENERAWRKRQRSSRRSALDFEEDARSSSRLRNGVFAGCVVGLFAVAIFVGFPIVVIVWRFWVKP